MEAVWSQLKSKVNCSILMGTELPPSSSSSSSRPPPRFVDLPVVVHDRIWSFLSNTEFLRLQFVFGPEYYRQYVAHRLARYRILTITPCDSVLEVLYDRHGCDDDLYLRQSPNYEKKLPQRLEPMNTRLSNGRDIIINKGTYVVYSQTFQNRYVRHSFDAPNWTSNSRDGANLQELTISLDDLSTALPLCPLVTGRSRPPSLDTVQLSLANLVRSLMRRMPRLAVIKFHCLTISFSDLRRIAREIGQRSRDDGGLTMASIESLSFFRGSVQFPQIKEYKLVGNNYVTCDRRFRHKIRAFHAVVEDLRGITHLDLLAAGVRLAHASHMLATLPNLVHFAVHCSSPINWYQRILFAEDNRLVGGILSRDIVPEVVPHRIASQRLESLVLDPFLYSEPFTRILMYRLILQGLAPQMKRLHLYGTLSSAEMISGSEKVLCPESPDRTRSDLAISTKSKFYEDLFAYNFRSLKSFSLNDLMDYDWRRSSLNDVRLNNLPPSVRELSTHFSLVKITDESDIGLDGWQEKFRSHPNLEHYTCLVASGYSTYTDKHAGQYLVKPIPIVYKVENLSSPHLRTFTFYDVKLNVYPQFLVGLLERNPALRVVRFHTCSLIGPLDEVFDLTRAEYQARRLKIIIQDCYRVKHEDYPNSYCRYLPISPCYGRDLTFRRAEALLTAKRAALPAHASGADREILTHQEGTVRLVYANRLYPHLMGRRAVSLNLDLDLRLLEHEFDKPMCYPLSAEHWNDFPDTGLPRKKRWACKCYGDESVSRCLKCFCTYSLKCKPRYLDSHCYCWTSADK